MEYWYLVDPCTSDLVIAWSGMILYIHKVPQYMEHIILAHMDLAIYVHQHKRYATVQWIQTEWRHHRTLLVHAQTCCAALLVTLFAGTSIFLVKGNQPITIRSFQHVSSDLGQSISMLISSNPLKVWLRCSASSQCILSVYCTLTHPTEEVFNECVMLVHPQPTHKAPLMSPLWQ